MVRLGDIYLAFYNAAQAIGWTFALYSVACTSQRAGKYNTQVILQVIQTLSILEVLHACLRLVRSSPLTTAIQISSRVFVLWGVLYMYPDVKVHSNFVLLMFVSWCLADITRYAYYFFNFLGLTPRFLTFIRYSMFLVLYPTGISGELGLLWHSLPYAAKRPWFALNMPNCLNFGMNTYDAHLLILILYAPLAPVMYSHMLSQRRKVLSQPKVKAA